MNGDSTEWKINLTLAQRIANPKSTFVIFILSVIIELYIIIIFFYNLDIWYIYIIAFLLVFSFQRSLARGESFAPKSYSEDLFIKISKGRFIYGVIGHELEIYISMKLEKGMFGCYNLFFGPAHSLIITRSLAEDEFFIKVMKDEGFLTDDLTK